MVDKRPRSARSPEYPSARKMPRVVETSAPRYAPRGPWSEFQFESASSSRQSSLSRTSGRDRPERERLDGQSSRSNYVPQIEVDRFGAAMDDFVESISMRTLKNLQLSKVRSDFEEMEPKCSAFPALRNYKTQRLRTAEQDLETAKASTKDVADMLKNALLDCLASSNTAKSDERLKERLDDMERENRNLKHRLETMERRTDDTARRTEEAYRSSSDRIEKNERLTRDGAEATENILKDLNTVKAQSKMDRNENRAIHQSLKELTNEGDRKLAKTIGDVENATTRLESLGANMQKLTKTVGNVENATTRLESLHADMGRLKKTIDDAEDVAGRLEVLRVDMEKLTKTVDNVKDVAGRLESLRADMENLPGQGPHTSTSISNTKLDELEARFEEQLKRIDKESEQKDEIIDGEVEGVKETIRTGQEETKLLISGLETRICDLEMLKTDHEKTKESISKLQTNYNMLYMALQAFEKRKDITQSTLDELNKASRDGLENHRAEVQTLINAQQAAIHNNTQRVDAQVNIISQHEHRLNSQTTDDMAAMMMNQWSQCYPQPAQVKGLVRQAAKEVQKLRDETINRLSISNDDVAKIRAELKQLSEKLG